MGVSSWRSGGRCRPGAYSARPRAPACASTVADMLSCQSSGQLRGQRKQVAPHVDVVMRTAMSPVRPGKVAGPSECSGASPAGYWCS
eukprot:6774611-Pyramimonas_sp.AAC.1